MQIKLIVVVVDWPLWVVRTCPQGLPPLLPLPRVQPDSVWVSFSLSTSVPLEEFDSEGTSKFLLLVRTSSWAFQRQWRRIDNVGDFPCTNQCTGVDPREKIPEKKNSTKLSWKPSSSCPKWCQVFRGVARIFQRGGGGITEATHQIVMSTMSTIFGLYRCSPSCISGLSRIIAAWRPILTKDKSRWRKYFTKKQILKKWAFQQWLLRPRYCHGVFATWIW